jgi:hypothetical protein
VDPGCLSVRIRVFSSPIPDQKGAGSRIRIPNKEFRNKNSLEKSGEQTYKMEARAMKPEVEFMNVKFR